MLISESEYREMEDCMMGFCPECDDFTRDMTEPDAEEYDCPECGNNNVCGAMNALMEGLIDISE